MRHRGGGDRDAGGRDDGHRRMRLAGGDTWSRGGKGAGGRNGGRRRQGRSPMVGWGEA
jgi:hypothetical protein